MTVPGEPVLTGVRAAQHPESGYDRLVLDITGPQPSYAIRYVSQVRADPSDRLISLPDSHFLMITLHRRTPPQGRQLLQALSGRSATRCWLAGRLPAILRAT